MDAQCLVLTELASSDLQRIDVGPRFRGGIDFLRNLTLRGWVVDLFYPKKPLDVTLFIEGVAVWEETTSIRRRDLERFLPGNVAGFAMKLSSHLELGAYELLHQLRSLPIGSLETSPEIYVKITGFGSRVTAVRNVSSRRQLLNQLERLISNSEAGFAFDIPILSLDEHNTPNEISTNLIVTEFSNSDLSVINSGS